MNSIDEVVAAWKSYVDTLRDWQDIVKNTSPQVTGCGLVYEIPNPIQRLNESFAIADMRQLKVAEPHYHNNETEIYIVIQGEGVSVVGHNEQKIGKDSVVITPPRTTHFTVPTDGLILAVINTPPFQRENYVSISETNAELQFDKSQFTRLTA
ncbi:MAG TPA: cupin domain-containing protein [Candidatus Saccharimonadales bacterium]|nr:cupin domain-containing protein [Candidatus Saccharimonadales bacterium]